MNEWELARCLLERDREWGAYALADLDPGYREFTDIWVTQDSIVLRYRGLIPPVLFTLGNLEEVDRLLEPLPAGNYQFTLLKTHRRWLEDRLLVKHEVEMARMVCSQPLIQQLPIGVAQRLGPADAEAVGRLIAEHPDGPDAFHPDQLESSTFYGIWQAGKLVSMAGTHVLSEEFSVAAVGNVFTHPNHRRSGHGRTVSAAVLQDLAERGIKTIVLNVHPGNQTAVRLYQELGFLEHCRYMEGVGEWSVKA